MGGGMGGADKGVENTGAEKGGENRGGVEMGGVEMRLVTTDKVEIGDAVDEIEALGEKVVEESEPEECGN